MDPAPKLIVHILLHPLLSISTNIAYHHTGVVFEGQVLDEAAVFLRTSIFLPLSRSLLSLLLASLSFIELPLDSFSIVTSLDSINRAWEALERSKSTCIPLSTWHTEGLSYRINPLLNTTAPNNSNTCPTARHHIPRERGPYSLHEQVDSILSYRPGVRDFSIQEIDTPTQVPIAIGTPVPTAAYLSSITDPRESIAKTWKPSSSTPTTAMGWEDGL